MGYYEIFLNVLRGKKGDKSPEICCDRNFLNNLHNALVRAREEPASDHVTKRVYKAFISGKTKDSNGNIRYEGLYPEMVRTTRTHASYRKREELPSKKAAYDLMGWDNGYYPDYNDEENKLYPMINSFNEYLFSKFYEAILNEWMGSTGESATWTYQDNNSNKAKLCSILKSTYKACYENTNTILEVYEYTKEYHMPSVTN
jgi:hypothetical protein